MPTQVLDLAGELRSLDYAVVQLQFRVIGIWTASAAVASEMPAVIVFVLQRRQDIVAVGGDAIDPALAATEGEHVLLSLAAFASPDVFGMTRATLRMGSVSLSARSGSQRVMANASAKNSRLDAVTVPAVEPAQLPRDPRLLDRI